MSSTRSSVHRRVVGGLVSYEEIGIIGGGQAEKRFRQDRRTDLGRSPAGAGEAREGLLSAEEVHLPEAPFHCANQLCEDGCVP